MELDDYKNKRLYVKKYVSLWIAKLFDVRASTIRIDLRKGESKWKIENFVTILIKRS